ncbi:uncharacterized protein LOC143186419 [Calliopsis andreniformis]|uniref:uncharacterized protein LOC143186419 n=1 Tax=Calliopsis andreniformis TaxID=337506 RepID=UPI003FCD5283
MAKLREYVLRARLMKEQGEKPFAENNMGFVRGRATMDAKERVRRIAKRATEQQKYAELVTLDVINAFNILKWKKILEEIERRLRNAYLRGNAQIIAFVYDVGISVESRTARDLKHKIELVINIVQRWLNSTSLELAKCGRSWVPPSPEIKYLGVTFDRARTFRSHITRVTNKAVSTLAARSPLMGNTTGTSQKSRRLLYNTKESIVLYGAPIWASAIYNQTNRFLLKIGLTRVVAAYRKVPMETLCVLTGVVPWTIKVEERKNLYAWEKYFLEDVEERRRPKRVTGTGYAEGVYDDDWLMVDGVRMVEDFMTARPTNISGADLGIPDGDEQEEKKKLKRWLRKGARKESLEKWQRQWKGEIVGR